MKKEGTLYQTERQKGNVLLLSLVLLGVVSLLGLSSMRGALVEESISISIQDQHLAVESAESALRAGERTLTTSSVFDQIGFYDSFQTKDDIPDIFSWDSSNSYQIPDATWGINNPQPAPQFKIELFAVPGLDLSIGKGQTIQERYATSPNYYRIIGYGQGRSIHAAALEESIVIYGKKE